MNRLWQQWRQGAGGKFYLVRSGSLVAPASRSCCHRHRALFPTHVKHLSWREPCCTRDKHKLEGSGEPVSRAGRARRSPERLVHIWRQRRAPGCAMWDPADGAPRVVGLACGSSHSVVLLQSERKGGDAAFAASLCAHRRYCRLLAAAAPHRPCLCAPAYFKRCCVLWQFDIRRSNRGG